VKTYPTFVSKGWKIIAELEEVFSLITRITSNGCQNEIENLYQATEIACEKFSGQIRISHRNREPQCVGMIVPGCQKDFAMPVQISDLKTQLAFSVYESKGVFAVLLGLLRKGLRMRRATRKSSGAQPAAPG
jgi:hypothetical protein